MRRFRGIIQLLLQITALAFLWTSMPVYASLPATDASEKFETTKNNASKSSSGCGHHAAVPEEDTGDDEDCNEAPSVSCVTCKCTGPAGFAFAGDMSKGVYPLTESTGATRPVKPALDPPRI